MDNDKGVWKLEYFEPLIMEELDEINESNDSTEELT
jgi:hypothetical protein